MALPSNIPTSFAPRSTPPRERFHFDFLSAFSFACYVVFAGTLVLAVGVFTYDRILLATLASKDADVATAESALNASEAQGFIQLNDRLMAGQTLLNTHSTISKFFDEIEGVLPSNVSLGSLQVTFSDQSVTISASGVAKSFNALAAASTGLSADGRIKDAVFSHLTINKDNTVAFSLTAVLDRDLVTYVAPRAATTTAAVPVLVAPVATTTATTTQP